MAMTNAAIAAATVELARQYKVGEIDEAGYASGLEALMVEANSIVPVLGEKIDAQLAIKADILTSLQAALNYKGEVPSISALPDDAEDGESYQLVDAAAPNDGHLYRRVAGAWVDTGPFRGSVGRSAYEVAVAHGFTGTEAEYAALPIDKAVLAETAAENADGRAAFAQEQGDYARDQGDYARDGGDAALAAAAAASTARDVARFKAVYTTRAALYADLAHDQDTLGVVTNDPTLEYNGTYAKQGDIGAGAWAKIDSVAGLIFQALPPETGYIFALVDNAGRAALLVRASGRVRVPYWDVASIPRTALGALSLVTSDFSDAVVTRAKLASEVTDVLASNLAPETGYALAIQDPVNKRAAFLVKFNGQVKIPSWVPASIPVAALGGLLNTANLAPGAITLDRLSSEVSALLASPLAPETGYSLAIMDPVSKRGALLLKRDGTLVIPKLQLGAGVINFANLDGSVTGLMGAALSAETGYSFVIMDPVTKRVAFGIKRDGTIVAPKLAQLSLTPGSVGATQLADGAVNQGKLEASLNRLIGPNVADVVPVWPDGWRSTLSPIMVRTEGSGYGWATFPPVLSPTIRGVNTTGQTLQFRRSSGLNVRGRRKIADLDLTVGTGSQINKGNFNSATIWPPTGTFAAGDYFEYTDAANRTIGSDTFTRGDLAVYDGSAWVRMAKPAVSIAGDWLQITGAGWWAGVQYAVGDFIYFYGQQAGGGQNNYRWGKGDPKRGEVFLVGEFTPASGLPASPIDGQLFLASAAGAVSGLTFAQDDMLLREDGAWIPIASEPVISVANGVGVCLPVRRDTSEWQVRRADKSAARLGVQLKGLVQNAPKRNVDGVLLAGDSMPGTIASKLAAKLSPRTCTTLSYGGGTADEVLAMLQRFARDLGDTYMARVLGLWLGQNNQGDYTQTEEVILRARALAGSRDIRLLVMTVLGARSFTYNGTRLVCSQHEDQFNNVTSSAIVHNREFLKAILPDQYLDTRAALVAAANTGLPDLQFPGMTEQQVATTYGIPPLSFWLDYATQSFTPSALSFQGYWATAGLPTGGSANQYYLRTSNGVVGALLVNIAGAWTEVTYDQIHINQTGAEPLATALVNKLTSKGW